MPQQTESTTTVLASSRPNNWPVILTIITMCIGGIGYMENTKTEIINAIHTGAIDHATLRGSVLQLESRTLALEKFRDRLETYFDKPKPIAHGQKEND